MYIINKTNIKGCSVITAVINSMKIHPNNFQQHYHLYVGSYTKPQLNIKCYQFNLSNKIAKQIFETRNKFRRSFRFTILNGLVHN